MKKLFILCLLSSPLVKASGMGASYNPDLLYLYLLLIGFLLFLLGGDYLVKYVKERGTIHKMLGRVKHLLKFQH